jgi:hypothetical protein
MRRSASGDGDASQDVLRGMTYEARTGKVATSVDPTLPESDMPLADNASPFVEVTSAAGARCYRN